MHIDLRSDTVTKPTPEMLQSMFNAQVGDDVYKEDPTVNALENKLAELFGMDSAIYFPTGSMANQAAIKLHTQPGEQLIADHYAHVYNYEGGGVSFNSGVSCKLLIGDRGIITSTQIEAVINPPDFYHSPLTSLVCLENTTNKGGGACYDLLEMKKIKEVCTAHSLGLHLDGARLWNAMVATNTVPGDYGAIFDTISVCLSKGLGAPMGSVLLGSSKVMEKALRVRKILGGGMRQIGYMAAAGNFAIDNHVQRLSEDHRRAKELANALQQCSFVTRVAPVVTNIIIFETNQDAQKVVATFAKQNVHFYGMGQGKLRMVTHLDYTETQHVVLLELLDKMR